jgi:hypothetical protein
LDEIAASVMLLFVIVVQAVKGPEWLPAKWAVARRRL